MLFRRSNVLRERSRAASDLRRRQQLRVEDNVALPAQRRYERPFAGYSHFAIN